MRETIIGLLFFASLAVVLYFAFTLGGPGSLEDLMGAEKSTVRISFREVTGLKEKDSVLVSGIRQGSIVGFEPQEDGSVLVVARINMGEVRLFANANAETIDVSALGGKAIGIDPGDPAQGPFPDGEIIPGEFVPNFLQSAGKLMTKVDRGIDDVLVIISDVKAMVGDIRSGKGAVGAIVSDDEVAANIKSIFGNVDKLTSELEKISRDVSVMTQKINSGESVVGRLVHDEVMGQNLSEMLETLNATSKKIEDISIEAREIVTKINEGKGPLGAAVNDEEMQADLKRLIDKAADTMEEAETVAVEATTLIRGINEGKGTIGLLFQDETLYNDLVRTVNTMQAGFEDIREQAPISTFASLAFQVFQ